MTTLTINPFDEDSIDKALDDLKNWRQDFDKKCDLFVQKLAEKGVEIAQAKVLEYNAVFNGELFDSLHVEKRKRGVYAIVSDSDHTAFVEFGTGQVGQSQPYPYPYPDGVSWEYNMGATIFEIHDGQYGWYYPLDDGTWRFTQGMPARPFMFETANELQVASTIESVAKEVFG